MKNKQKPFPKNIEEIDLGIEVIYVGEKDYNYEELKNIIFLLNKIPNDIQINQDKTIVTNEKEWLHQFQELELKDQEKAIEMIDTLNNLKTDDERKEILFSLKYFKRPIDIFLDPNNAVYVFATNPNIDPDVLQNKIDKFKEENKGKNCIIIQRTAHKNSSLDIMQDAIKKMFHGINRYQSIINKIQTEGGEKFEEFYPLTEKNKKKLREYIKEIMNTDSDLTVRHVLKTIEYAIDIQKIEIQQKIKTDFNSFVDFENKEKELQHKKNFLLELFGPDFLYRTNINTTYSNIDDVPIDKLKDDFIIEIYDNLKNKKHTIVNENLERLNYEFTISTALHDIGKVLVDKSILDYAGPIQNMDPLSKMILFMHDEIAKGVFDNNDHPLFKKALKIALGHHGRGKDKDYEIELAVLIDMTDALFSPRSYKPGFKIDLTEEEIIENNKFIGELLKEEEITDEELLFLEKHEQKLKIPNPNELQNKLIQKDQIKYEKIQTKKIKNKLIPIIKNHFEEIFENSDPEITKSYEKALAIKLLSSKNEKGILTYFLENEENMDPQTAQIASKILDNMFYAVKDNFHQDIITVLTTNNISEPNTELFFENIKEISQIYLKINENHLNKDLDYFFKKKEELDKEIKDLVQLKIKKTIYNESKKSNQDVQELKELTEHLKYYSFLESFDMLDENGILFEYLNINRNSTEERGISEIIENIGVDFQGDDLKTFEELKAKLQQNPLYIKLEILMDIKKYNPNETIGVKRDELLVNEKAFKEHVEVSIKNLEYILNNVFDESNYKKFKKEYNLKSKDFLGVKEEFEDLIEEKIKEIRKKEEEFTYSTSFLKN